MMASQEFAPIFALHKDAQERRYPTYDWRDGLLLSERGTPRALLANVLQTLRQADEWEGVLSYDSFTMAVSLVLPPPWEDSAAPWTPRPWNGQDDVRATEWIQRHVGLGVGLDIVASAIETAAHENETHVVRDYLNGLKWDQTCRLDRWLHSYLGADDNGLMEAFGRCFMIAAVARVMKPASKVDTMLVLEGRQGAGKSTALSILGGPWFTDEIADLGSKDAAMQMAGKWVVELSELDAMSKSEATRTKAFLSRSVDHYRPPYGRSAIDAPRQCVFAGTTNNDAWQKDETGGRRFWPVRVGKLDLAGLRRDRDQLWAEATYAYRQGANWWLEDEATIAAAEDEQAARYQGDPWDDPIQRFVTDRTLVNTREILTDCLGVELQRHDRASEMRVSRVLKTLGFQRHQTWNGGSRRWEYWRE